METVMPCVGRKMKPSKKNPHVSKVLTRQTSASAFPVRGEKCEAVTGREMK